MMVLFGVVQKAVLCWVKLALHGQVHVFLTSRPCCEKLEMRGCVKIRLLDIGTNRSSEPSPRELKQGKDGRSYAWTAQRLLELEKEVDTLKGRIKVRNVEHLAWIVLFAYLSLKYWRGSSFLCIGQICLPYKHLLKAIPY